MAAGVHKSTDVLGAREFCGLKDRLSQLKMHARQIANKQSDRNEVSIAAWNSREPRKVGCGLLMVTPADTGPFPAGWDTFVEQFALPTIVGRCLVVTTSHSSTGN